MLEQTSNVRVAGALRVAALGVGLLVLGSGAFVWRLKVHADELMLSVGAQMMHYARADRALPAQSVTLNGQTFHIAVTTTTDAPDDALDHFAARCGQRDGFAHASNAGHASHAGLLDGVIRTPQGDEGAVACLDSGRAERSASDMFARLKEFVRTSDVSRVGELRFAHAKRIAPGHTLLVTSWVDGPLDLGRMFPEFGDAPGAELSGIPRPKGSRRLLSAHSPSGSARLNSYAADASEPLKPAAAYREQLIDAGFRASELPSQGSTEAFSFAAQRGAEAVVVMFREPGDGTLETTLIALR